LGRVLFWDARLSANDAVSCASCHKPELAFADDVAFSEGFLGERTSRNSLALGAFPSFNAYYGFGGSRLFWDERAGSVQEQSTQTLQNPVEMGTKLHELGDKILKEDYYQVLFRKAFPENEFGGGFSTDQKILRALEAFVNSIGCFNSKYDQEIVKGHLETQNFSGFTAEENQGKQLFQQNCASCHNLGAGFATSVTTANNGLDETYTDDGLGGVTQQYKDKGVFKVPMLRNVVLTAPYMHDGRFKTLEEVVEHYNSGVKLHDNLHESLRDLSTGEPKRLNLSEDDKAALIAFLHTLTDESAVLAVKYSDPFK
ncbi:MAG: cytochrome c peroxidase, partial [Bacteroidota bacterium]